MIFIDFCVSEGAQALKWRVAQKQAFWNSSPASAASGEVVSATAAPALTSTRTWSHFNNKKPDNTAMFIEFQFKSTIAQ